MVSDGTGDEVIPVGIAAVNEEFRHPIACRGTFDMLAEGPPTVIVHFPEILLRTVEEGYVLAHPLRRSGIGDGGDDVLILHRIEVLRIMGEIVVFEHGSTAVGIKGFRYDIREEEGRHRVVFISSRHVEVLVGGGVDVGLVEGHTRTENNT